MTFLDQQFMTKDEVTYGTGVTVDRSWLIESESIEDDFGRTEGDPLMPGAYMPHQDMWTPYYRGGAGPVEMAVLSKGFGWWLKHMLGGTATTGPVTSLYTHTGTCAPIVGDFFTAQVTRPFNPSGTAQAFTFSGCKLPSWELNNTVDGNLLFTANIDAAACTTATAAATFAIPSSAEPLTWAGGILTLGGASTDITEFGLSVDNGMDVDRRQIRGNTQKKEPTGDARTASVSLSADFESLTQRNRASSLTKAGALASLSMVWTAPTDPGGGVNPSLTITIPALRFDTFSAPNAARGEGISQSLEGAVRWTGSGSPLTVVYKSTDTVA